MTIDYTRRSVLAASAVLLLCCAALFHPANAQRTGPESRPNILFILADDLGYADVGFTGGREIRTPNLDGLASAGARLEQFYVQQVCSPTRAALMTGRYPMRHGLQVGVVRPWAQYGLPLEERTLPQALREAGYATALVGKWHLGHFQRAYLPTERGFDRQYGHYNGAIDYFTHIRDGGFDWHRDDRASYDEGYSTHLIAQEAVRFIREFGGRRPFFLDVSFNAPHAPHQVPEKYKERYTHLKEPRRTYAGMVAAMDEAVGQIIAALDEKALRQNTLIVFSSDNGGPAPGEVTDNGPLRAGKTTLYEGGVRVAAFTAWTGRIQPGTVVSQPLHMVDWYPTLLKMAGASLEQKLPVDGRDAWPTIAAKKPSPHAEILLNATPQTGAIRAGDWKLILNGDYNSEVGDAEGGRGRATAGNRVELFNLADDPSEKRNLADKYPDKVKALRARYDALAAQAVAPKIRPRSPDFRVPKVWGESGWQQTAANADEVLKREHQRVDYLVSGKLDQVAEMLSPTLSYTHSSAVLDSKEKVMEALRSGQVVYKSLKHQDVQVRFVTPDVAILNGLSDINVVVGGKPQDVPVRFTIVYVKKNGVWLMEVWHATRRSA